MDVRSPTPEAFGRSAATPAPERASAPEAAEQSGPERAGDPVRATLRVGGFASDRELLVQGRQAFERGDDAAALEHLARLADHGLPYADLYYMLGVLQERAGELDVALESLRRAVRINPAYVEALLALASLHERRGDFERSRGYAERASQLTRPVSGELDPTTRGKLANLQAALADALAAAGERRDAIEEYRRALDRCPTYHDIRHRLAVTLREAGLPFQAAQELRRILRLQPSMLMSQIQLGLTYYSMGRTPEAIAEWEAVLERDPSRDEARMYLRLVRGASRHAEIAATVEGLARTTTAGERVAEPSRAGWSTTALAGRSERGEGAVDATDGTIPDVADPPDASMRARPASEPVHG